MLPVTFALASIAGFPILPFFTGRAAGIKVSVVSVSAEPSTLLLRLLAPPRSPFILQHPSRFVSFSDFSLFYKLLPGFCCFVSLQLHRELLPVSVLLFLPVGLHRACLAFVLRKSSESYRPAEMAHSNLRSFLKSTTPRVRPQFIPKTSIWKLNNQCQLLGGKGLVEYFTLEDLWNCYEEWSAYGAGIPMRLSNHENVVQYYTPFLSGIQIYTAKSVNLRIVREDFEEAETDSTSSDSDAGKLSRTDSNGSNRMWDSDDSWTDPDVDLKAKERLGKLYFQYFDSTSPHLRLPLKNMVNQLAEEHPGLISLRSVDLSSASWMSVAWYPIYHIPGRRNPKELYSAFLTYHTLSSLFQDNIPIGRVKHEEKIKHEGDAIVLPPFGLATYKMQKQVWVNHQAEDRQKIASLFSVADSWLKQLNVYHPDFSFFRSRSI
ncbi:hypothetical protein Taro_026446 [Colocasia esculenta]|uniref:Uncharacterized protein n=1 Tax=Colocasia esculenta TaxID=4460 RepID=A0A843VJI7_COLES|nr:hypothetical protein [Colocasia esculenta]